ncbi:hypothetical protein B0H11DRAFT_1932994 [Mycena galericulata]|nr:hypothetical protein B0H11DRAFT_1932994 [Mycena galericulata]
MPAASPLGLRTSLHMHTALCPTVWLGRPPPFIRLASLRGSGVPLRSSAWLACAAPASPSVHPPGWLARLRRPPPFIRLAGLRGSGVPRRSSAWLACVAPASPSIHLPGLRGSGFLLRSSAFPHKQTLIAYTSSLAGVGLMDMSVHKAKGVCGYIHTGYIHKWTYPP